MTSSPSSALSLHVLSLNCWGLKYIATHRHARLAEIGRLLALRTPVPHIVGLQECWTQEDYDSIREQTRHILPYGKFYYSGIFGGGLAILSRWPIVESSMVRYPLNGRPTAFFRGDWFVGKGVACARIEMDGGETAEVFCTHLHAPYEREPNDSYLCHRTAQAWEISKLLRAAAERGHLVIGLGDFNMIPLSLAHQLITTHAPVEDVWRTLHPDSSIGAAIDDAEKVRGRVIPTAEYNLQENGTTCDSAMNTWRWDKSMQKRVAKGEDLEVDVQSEDPRAKRLDYIFTGHEPHGHASSGPYQRWAITDVRLSMTERHPTLKCSLSDHFAVEATLQKGTASVGLTRSRILPSSTYTSILSLISTYNARERRQRRLRLSHFGLQLLLSVGCHVAVWFSPRPFVGFLLMLLSSLGLAAGVIDGLIGGLFVGSELRALKEFEWEIRAARSRAEVMEREGSDEKGATRRETCRMARSGDVAAVSSTQSSLLADDLHS
ncbi:MAG: phospholipase C type enzyme [Caeruleum heppii]|nr:MAG: phospholipase C type enzyme [Caeruleum heppii]